MRITIFSTLLLVIAIASCNSNSTNQKTQKIEVTFIDEHYRNCDMRNRYLSSGEEIFSEFDTMCATMQAHIPTVTSPNAEAMERINTAIINVFCNGENDSTPCGKLEEIQKRFDQSASEEGFDLEITGSVLTNSHDYLAIVFERVYYSFGAAHPLASTTALNFDLKSGKVISLNDCLKPNTQELVTSIVEKKFKSEYGSEEMENGADEGGINIPDTEPFVLPADFVFTDRGLVFYFDMYENGPASNGLLDIAIPYSELSGCLNADSEMGKWVSDLEH